jgi:hypothetical protein
MTVKPAGLHDRRRIAVLPVERYIALIPRPSPVSGDGDQVLMNDTPPFRGILSATRFRMR